MPAISLDTADAAELAELLQFITGWLASDPARLAASLLAFVGHPAYGTRELQDDMHRFAFLLGGSDGEDLFDPQDLCRPPAPARRALPPTTPASARPRRRQRAGVLTRHRRPAAGSPS